MVNQKNENATARTPQNLSRIKDACFAFNLRRAARIVTRRYEDALRPLGVTAFQFTTLAALSSKEVLPQSAFPDLFGMDMSTVSRNLAAMARKGWVTYVAAPGDGRVRHVRLTPEGADVFEAAFPLWEGAQASTTTLIEEGSWDATRAWLSDVSREPA